LRRTALAFVTVTLACGSGEVSYAPDADARFASTVLGAYAAAGGISLLVCEDKAPGALACTVTSTSDCGSSCHVIRGDGTSASESLGTGSGGCDCSTPNAELSVRADLVLAGGSALALRGTVAAAPSEGDPYGAPLALRVSEGDGTDHLATSLRGEVRDGQMLLRLSGLPPDAGPSAWPAASGTSVPFARTGPCP
jgi:hypothetical protein